jgi:opacity protein-like surface antigen
MTLAHVHSAGPGFACCIVLSSLLVAPARAADVVPIVPAAPSGFFVGGGGSFNGVHLKQTGDGIGLTDVHDGETLVGFGVAVGPMPTFKDTDHVFAPDLQAGYFGFLDDDADWIWGFKAGYKYLGVELTDRGIDSPQTGTIVTLYPEPEEGTLTGNAIAKSSQTQINHEVLFVPFLGHSFSGGFFYAGAGPALFGTKSKLNDLVGLADINGNKFDLTGTPIDFSSSQWMWGGAVQAGVSYFIGESWFVDLNYTYARSREYEEKYSAPFTNLVNGYTYSGTVGVESRDRITSQGVSLTINMLF